MSRLALLRISLRFFPVMLFLVCLCPVASAQGVGIGTTTPDSSSILDVRSTQKGILFPSMTTAQRNAIDDPADGLHIFNTTDRCLNFYDGLFQVWNCYCEDCRIATVRISQSGCGLDFFQTYGFLGDSILVVIDSNVVLSGCEDGGTALDFTSTPLSAGIRILNYGTIAGAGGIGGEGITSTIFGCSEPAGAGGAGGHAIKTNPGVMINVNNYGIIAGGGGGGGGGGSTGDGGGGGGGGGAGIIGGAGGAGGVYYDPFCITILGNGNAGAQGTATIGGAGGTGAGSGAAGGTGGNRAQPGASGGGTGGALGGVAGKAISGGSGNMITNLGGGQTFGAID